MVAAPKVLFLNPWGRLIGPNRYLIEMLRHSPDLASGAIVVFHEQNDAAGEYRDAGSTIIHDPAVAQIRAQWSLRNAAAVMRHHTVGLWRMLKIMRRVKPDLVMSNTEQLLIGGLLARICGIPHIKVFHAMTFAYRLADRPLFMRTYLFFLTLWCDVVVAVSETLRQALISGGVVASKVVTLPNPVPCAYLREASGKLLPDVVQDLLEKHTPIIISAGVIFPKKGQDRLIEALARISKVYPDILCLFAGKVGESSGVEDTVAYFTSLKQRVDELGLSNNVVFLGEIDYLPALMGRADIYVQTSRTESFCRTVAEALVCGTPVVAFDAGAISEVAGPGAVIIREGDIPGLAHAVEMLLSNPDRMKTLVSEGSGHVEEHYDAGRISRIFSEFIISLNRRKRHCGLF